MPEHDGEYSALVDWITKAGGILLVATYLAGFLVVSLHLTRYGISTLGLFHLKYLVAGSWALGPAVLLVAFYKSTLRFSRKAHDYWTRPRIRHAVITTTVDAVPIFLITYLVQIYLGGIPPIAWKSSWKFLILFILAGNFIDLFSLSLTTEEQFRTWYVNRAAVPLYALVLLTVLLVYVGTFSQIVYPSIPYAFGGGKPLSVSFVEGEKRLPDSLVVEAQSRRTIPYQLLEESEKSYYVISTKSSEQSIEIPRDSVSGMVVLK